MAAKNRSGSHGGWEGQLIIDVILLGPMATNSFPVLCKWFDKLKRSKITGIKSKYDNINKDSHELTSCLCKDSKVKPALIYTILNVPSVFYLPIL